MSSELRLLYCDDRPGDVQQFVERHGSEFRIEVVTDLSQIARALTDDRHLPDLVVLDLYHPRRGADFEHRRDEAEQRLDELTEAIARAKLAVDRAWAPQGIDILEELRAKYSPRQLPVMITTRRGLLLLDTDELLRIERSDAEWLLKDHDPVVNASRMRTFTHRLRSSPRLQRDVTVSAASTIAGTIAGAILSHIVS